MTSPFSFRQTHKAAAFLDSGVHKALPACNRFFEASEPLAADSWELQNELQASQQSKACTSLAWRPHSAGLPPLLLVGTAADSAQVWMYREPLMRWELATSLGTLQVRQDWVGGFQLAGST